MVFSSGPIYLDTPNWTATTQQPAHQCTNGGGGELLPPGLASGGGDVMAGAVAGAGRAVSMSERARLAKVPAPEAALKCPRCDSTNTKFCYFNNYSLSQPRHFCKTCRRYWTRGGSLRNVPVGGGCRRNKRSKSSSSSAGGGGGGGSKRAGAAATSSSSTSTTAGSCADAALPSGNAPPHGQLGQLPFLSSLQSLPYFSGGGGDVSHLGLSLAGVPAMDSLDAYHMAAAGFAGIGALEQWRLPQMQQPLFQPAPAPGVQGPYPFTDSEGGGDDGYGGGVLPKASAASAALLSQLASVKMEDSGGAPSWRPPALGQEHYWGGGGWAAAAAFDTSPASGSAL